MTHCVMICGVCEREGPTTVSDQAGRQAGCGGTAERLSGGRGRCTGYGYAGRQPLITRSARLVCRAPRCRFSQHDCLNLYREALAQSVAFNEWPRWLLSQLTRLSMSLGYAPGRHDMRARGLEQALVPKDRRALQVRSSASAAPPAAPVGRCISLPLNPPIAFDLVDSDNNMHCGMGPCRSGWNVPPMSHPFVVVSHEGCVRAAGRRHLCGLQQDQDRNLEAEDHAGAAVSGPWLGGAAGGQGGAADFLR
jgi:hypothetical protein